MMRVEQTVTLGALLHDIGKVMFRARGVDGRAHSLSGVDLVKKYTQDQGVLDCIRYHHRYDIRDADLESSNPAYIVYIADNISAGVDRRDIEGASSRGFDKNRPLESIYNLINNRTSNLSHSPCEIRDKINYPGEESSDLSTSYNDILMGFSQGMQGIPLEPKYINSLMELCEAYLSYVPSSTSIGQVSDISLFDHSKIAANLASCIYLYLADSERTNYKVELFDNEQTFLSEKAFCLVSLDISGIQQFIYSISSKGALKGLRARSFYIELLLENTVDEILAGCGLTRANILYTGGGHAYMLIPNTDQAKSSVDTALKNINRQLMDKFKSALFIAYGIEDCSGNELMSKTDDPESYSNIFRNVSSQISSMKLRRYSADDLRRLNDSNNDKEGRECVICGVSEKLHEGKNMCVNCVSFTEISSELLKPNCIFAILQEKKDECSLPVFSRDGNNAYLHAMSQDEIRRMLRDKPELVVRLYSKNTYRTGLSLATKLWMGDYYVKNLDDRLKTFEELAKASEGVDRIGVLRADVDNLGTTFINGFVREDDAEDKNRYVTISRTARLSRSLSIYFKYYINTVLSNPSYSLTSKEGPRNVVIVYSGGDDVFLVGAWDDVLSAAIDLYASFKRYTDGALTLSAGFSVFDYKYPISRMAEETGELESRAKANQYSNGKKNSISLFGLELKNDYLTDNHTYDWTTFIDIVLGEKYKAIQDLYSAGGDYGNTFLYNILSLLKYAEDDRINIARLAYLLARHEPSNKEGSIRDVYLNFSKHIYTWALDEDHRRQLITAIMIYVYTMRTEGEGNRNA